MSANFRDELFTIHVIAGARPRRVIAAKVRLHDDVRHLPDIPDDAYWSPSASSLYLRRGMVYFETTVYYAEDPLAAAQAFAQRAADRFFGSVRSGIVIAGSVASASASASDRWDATEACSSTPPGWPSGLSLDRVVGGRAIGVTLFGEAASRDVAEEFVSLAAQFQSKHSPFN